MRTEYQLTSLPLTTEDSDPIWAQFIEIFRTTLLLPKANPEAVEVFRTGRRFDDAVLRMVTANGPGLGSDQPVAGCCAVETTINAGHDLLGLYAFHTIAVMPSHRRRGLLRQMMTTGLAEAHQRGAAFAALSASEATIYSRFGFGPMNHTKEVEVDTRDFAFAPWADVAEPSIEFVDPSYLADHWDQLMSSFQKRHPGAIFPPRIQYLLDTGAWDQQAQAPSNRLRAVVHFDAAGIPDGFATFTHTGWDRPLSAIIRRLCAADVAVERALWQALVSMDLIDRLKFESATEVATFSLALQDPRAVSVRGSEDMLWLRILDLPLAVGARQFEADGSVDLEVVDELGYCAGNWRLSVSDGRGSCIPIESSTQLQVPIEALAMAWFGNTSIRQLAQSGRITGDEESISLLHRLLSLEVPGRLLAEF